MFLELKNKDCKSKYSAMNNRKGALKNLNLWFIISVVCL